MALTKVTLTGAVDTIKAGWTEFNDLIDDLAATTTGLGASCIGVYDVGNNMDADNVEDALNFLANQFFVSTTAPTSSTTNLAEGDLYYDTDDNQLKIYRETSSGTFEFVPIMIGNDSADSDTVDAGSF